MAQIQSQIRLHVDSTAQNLIPRLAARLSSNTARLGSRLMMWQVGPTMLPCQLTRCMLQWHASCAWWCHDYVILIWVWHVGRVNWYSGRVSPFGWKRRVWRVARVASHPADAWGRVWTFLTFDFNVVFTSGFVSSSSTQWYGQNIILKTFIFEQKSNTTLNHMLWYQLLGIRPVMLWYLPIGG